MIHPAPSRSAPFSATAAILVLFLSSVPTRADLVEHGPKDSPPSGLLAGVARADITPPVGIVHLNWGSQTHIEAEGIDPAGMLATALVVSNGVQKFAMVDIDSIFTNPFLPAIEKASEATGIPVANIRLGATHTHAGPLLSSNRGPANKDLSEQREKIARYHAQAIDKITGAIMEANAKLQPAHLYAGRGTGSINVNRRFRAQGEDPPAVGRNPDGFVDPELLVVRIDDAKGNPLAAIVNFQCHGTVLAYENKFISPDWIGMTRKVVEQALPGAMALYFQGAAGNQGPIEGFTGDLNVPHRLGSILGHEAAAIALRVETVDRQPKFEGFVESTAYQAKQHWRVNGPRDATMKFASTVVDVPRRDYTEEELTGMKKRIADAKGKLAAARLTNDPWKIHQAEARLRRFSDLLEQWRQPADPTPAKIEVQILRIGDVAIVAMPGEPFGEIGQAVKKASPFKYTLFCGYSDGIGGDYLPTEDEYRYGGYEVERTPYGLGADKKLIAGAIALFERVK